jgi:choline dehydrogenase-like flavoprotein
MADRHYASDVLVGFGVGFGFGYAVRVVLHYTRCAVHAQACRAGRRCRAELDRRVLSVLTGQLDKAERVGFSVFGTMIPTLEDGVELAAGAASGDRSRLRYSLRYPEKALAVLHDARDELLAIFRDAGLEPTVETFHVEAPGTSVHYGGTCRMHASPRHGVVDQSGRVFGARNVVVADSAVFTTGPEKNPVLTAMALAARSSQWLADELQEGDL